MADSKAAVIRCKRCGKCCIVYLRGRWESCKYLRIIGDKTYCRCFHSRLNKIVGKNQFCGLRKDTPYDFPNCPYNTGKPIHPAYLNIRTTIIKDSSYGGIENCEEEGQVENDAQYTPDQQDGAEVTPDRKRIILEQSVTEEVGVKKVCLD